MTYRGLVLLIGAGLLSLLSGCRSNCQGRCDCLVHPISHGTPSPIVQPAQPLAPVPAQ